MNDRKEDNGKVILGLIIITAVIFFSGSIYTKPSSKKDMPKKAEETIYIIIDSVDTQDIPQGVLVNSSVRG